jgi:hypothetical protein
MRLHIKVRGLFFIFLTGCLPLSAQLTVNIPVGESNLKVWGEGENTYIQTNVPWEGSGFWGVVSKKEVVRFYKITAKTEVKELVFDVMQPYITNKDEMKKQFFYFGHYVLLVVQTDAILFDLETETHQVLIDNDPLFLSDTWYNIFYNEKDGMLTLVATNGGMKIFKYDLAEGELTNEEFQMDGIKLKRPEVVYENKVVCRYEVDKTAGWLIMDIDTKEAEQIEIPDKFPKFRSCDFYCVPGSDDIYMKIVAELTNSYNSKVSTYLYKLSLNDHTLEKKIENDEPMALDKVFRFGSGILFTQGLESEGYGVETNSFWVNNNEVKLVKSGGVNQERCFYHEGEFYCYKEISKTSTGKPQLYKLWQEEYVWKQEKLLNENGNIKPYLFYVNGKPQSIFIEQEKGFQTISFTPRIF